MCAQTYCGIDFGTSNSTCAIYQAGGPRLVPLEGEKFDMPSAVFYEDGGDVLFGREGISAYIDGEDGRLMRGLKSMLGTALMNERTVINGRATYFKDILRAYLSHIKKRAEQAAGEKIEKVVMGRPVHFHDDAPDADLESEDVLREVAGYIGFKDVVFQYEPIAAAFSHERLIQNEKLSLVVDLGGGTSDFTVIRLSPSRQAQDDRLNDILATGGVRIGGTNFDKRLSMQSFMPYLGLGSQYGTTFDQSKLLDMPTSVYQDLSDWPRVHFAQTQKALNETQQIRRTSLAADKLDRLIHLQKNKLGHAYLQQAEQAKIALSECDAVDMKMAGLGYSFHVPVNVNELHTAIDDQIDKIRRTMLQCLSDAGVTAQEIELVVLTGGSSELPVVNDMVRKAFPAADLSVNDKFCSVGLGLAYTAPQVFR